METEHDKRQFCIGRLISRQEARCAYGWTAFSQQGRYRLFLSVIGTFGNSNIPTD